MDFKFPHGKVVATLLKGVIICQYLVHNNGDLIDYPMYPGLVGAHQSDQHTAATVGRKIRDKYLQVKSAVK